MLGGRERTCAGAIGIDGPGMLLTQAKHNARKNDESVWSGAFGGIGAGATQIQKSGG